MGLAASQARFLGLTARKSNIEYQGQQINQARTALSNEVMDLYQKYNNLDVPVPPSVNDYVKTVYKLNSTYENYEISNPVKITSGENEGYYNVKLLYTEDIPIANTYTAKNAIVKIKKSEDEEAQDKYSYLSFTIGTDVYYYDTDDKDNSTITKITGDYDKYAGLTTVMEKLGMEDGIFYMYTKNNTAYYEPEKDITYMDEQHYFNEQGVYNGDYTFDYQSSKPEEKTINAIASLSQTSNGRLSAISIVDCEDDKTLVGNTYPITTTSEDDEKEYEDAMNKYYYDKAKYEREVELINKKTEKIQTEDKALELKLNQLDTEQKAVSTEMDSITKVIEKTIENVYKTYNS